MTKKEMKPEDLQAEVELLTEENKDLKKKVEDLQKLADEAQSLREGAEEKVKALEVQNEDLQKRVAELVKMVPPEGIKPQGVRYIKKVDGKGSDGKGNLVKYVSNPEIAKQLEEAGWKKG